MMKNNKGQVLVAFVLMLPIIIMFCGLIIDCGYLFIEKRKVDNNIKDAITYGLNNIELEEEVIRAKITKILNVNIDDISTLEINIENKSVDINLEKYKKGIFTNIFSKQEYKISSHYKGYINEDKIVIRKV